MAKEPRPKGYPKLKNYKPSQFMLPTSHYDKKKADRAVTFIENLCHTKGKWAGTPFWLLPWQEQLIRDIFGIVKPDGNRQFRTAFVEICKKVGKSELAAAVALYLLYADNEPSAEVYGAAADRQQASIVFDVAKQMVEMSPALMKRSKLMGATKRIVNYSNAGYYQVLSAEVGGKHGFSVSGLVFDEIHTQPNRQLYDVLTKGSSDARQNPLHFIITTAGNDRHSMEKRAKVWEAAKNFVDTHENENGVLSAEDSATYERMEAEIEDLTKAIDRHRKAEEMEKNLNQPVNQPLTGKPYAGGQGEPKTGRASDEYRRAMLNALRSNFRQVSNTLQEGVDADGGYLVPEEYDRRLVDVLNEENIMRRLATRIVTSGEHKINIAATKPAASWIEEGGALTFGDATFDQKILDAHKLHVAIKVTEELLYDNAFNLENYIIVQFGKALANAEEDAFLNGNGTGKPTGIFDGTGGGHLLNTLAAALKSDDMLDLVYGLKRPYRKNASFIMNDATLPSLRKLKDNNGAYIWQPAYQAGEPDRILGYKVETSAYAPKDGIAFGDYSYYNIGDRGNRSFKQLNELFAGNGMIGFVAKERVDGKLVLPEAVQIMKLKAD